MPRRPPVHRGNGFPYFPAYAGDWLGSGTRARLTVEQRGAFWDLIFHQWQAPDCMLPDDESVLAAFSGLGARWPKIGRTIVERAFVRKGGKLFNARLLRERRKLESKSRKASAAGVKSGETRRKRSNGRSTDVERTGNHPDPDPDPDLSSTHKPPLVPPDVLREEDHGARAPQISTGHDENRKRLKAVVWAEVRAALTDGETDLPSITERVKVVAGRAGFDYGSTRELDEWLRQEITLAFERASRRSA